jgi:hypothetical protein
VRRCGTEQTLRFLVASVRFVRVHRLEGELEYGFEDPADTGRVHGWVSAAAAALGPAVQLECRPDWSFRTVAAGRLAGRADVLVVPLLLSAAARYRSVRPRIQAARASGAT